MTYNICSDAIRWQIHDFLCDGNSIVCSICHHLRDIRKTNKMRKFDLQNESHGQGEKRDLRHSTSHVQFCISDFFFRILAIWEHTFTQKVTHACTHTYTYAARDISDDYTSK